MRLSLALGREDLKDTFPRLSLLLYFKHREVCLLTVTAFVDRLSCTIMALIPIAIAALVAYQVISYALRLRFHINEAKRSGLPYIVLRASTNIHPPASLHGPL